jgi:hypothetical protein
MTCRLRADRSLVVMHEFCNELESDRVAFAFALAAVVLGSAAGRGRSTRVTSPSSQGPRNRKDNKDRPGIPAG